MSKIGVPRYQAGHTGKTGTISTTSIGTPKPFPFSIVEQGIVNTYPKYRKFLPGNIQPYTDEIYDFRTLPYKEWYDKRGKAHINKWWQQQLDAISLYETSLQTAKNIRQRSNSRTINDGRSTYNKRRLYQNNSIPIDLCCRKCQRQHRSSGQRPYSKRRSSYRYSKHRSYY